MGRFESRPAGDGTHYVIGREGHLAHTETEDGGQQAAIGLTEERATQVADDLNNGRRP